MPARAMAVVVIVPMQTRVSAAASDLGRASTAFSLRRVEARAQRVVGVLCEACGNLPREEAQGCGSCPCLRLRSRRMFSASFWSPHQAIRRGRRAQGMGLGTDYEWKPRGEA